jgi:putative membrane protein
MNVKSTWLTGALMVTLAGAVIAAAPGTAPAISSGDAEFVQKAAESGHAEVAAGELARAKAADEDVREFAAQMVTDHTTGNEELAGIAAEKGIEVPTSPGSGHDTMKDQLDSASGAAFDRVYVEQFGVAAHKAAVDLFTDQATNGSDPELVAFAQKMLPTIEHHYSMAQELAASLED